MDHIAYMTVHSSNRLDKKLFADLDSIGAIITVPARGIDVYRDVCAVSNDYG